MAYVPELTIIAMLFPPLKAGVIYFQSMISKEEAEKIFLDFINKNGRYPFIINSIELSFKKDFWVIGANTADPYPKAGGVYGYLLNSSSGEIFVSGPEGPFAYLEDKYNLEEADGRFYVLKPKLSESKESILLIKKVFKLDYSKSKTLNTTSIPWFTGSKRYLVQTSKLLSEYGIDTVIELANDKTAYVEVKSYYSWGHLPIEELQSKI